MKKISVKQKSVKLFAPVRKGSEQRSASEGKAFPFFILLRRQPATSAISVLGAGAGAAVSGLSGGGGVLAKTGVSAATNVAGTVTVNAIQCGGDWDKFADSMKNFYTWKGCISSTAGSLVTNSMNAVFLEDGNRIALNGDTFNTSGISSLTSLTGGLASTSVTYGLTGNATLNVASVGGQGVLELSFGKDGMHTRLGTGGTNVSWQTLMSAASGVGEARKVASWKYGGEESRSTLNAINMLGYTGTKDDRSNKKLAKDIWNETLGVEYGDTGKDYGNYKVGDGKITLSKDLLGGGKEASAKLATVMSHEGTHYNGNRLEGVAHAQALGTYAQINEMFNLDGDASFSIQMIDAIMNPDSWKENTGDTDHWTRLSNGGLKQDQDGWLRDEKGNLIKDKNGNPIGANTAETGLLNILFAKQEDGSYVNPGKTYSEFTDEQKTISNYIMSDAEISSYYEDPSKMGMENLKWNKDGKELDMDLVMAYAEDSIVTQVFERYYDSTADARYAQLHNLDVDIANTHAVTEAAAGRFDNLYDSKSSFYDSIGALVDNDDTIVSQGYKKYFEGHYETYNGLHYGIDIITSDGKDGASILAGISGKVAGNYKDTEDGKGGGNSIHIQYGYDFEELFFGTGIYGEYDHFKYQSEYSIGQKVSANTKIGVLGSTGNSTGPHLHYSVYTQGLNDYSDSTMKLIFGNNYKSTIMRSTNYNKDGSIKSYNNKYVYDPFGFYGRYKK